MATEHNPNISQDMSTLEAIVILGNNLHAYSAAARLSQALQEQSVTISLVESEPVSVPGIIELGLSAHAFHAQLGLAEADLIKHLNGAYSYGLALQGWQKPNEFDGIFTWSPSGQLIDGVHFHHYLNKLRKAKLAVSLEPFSVAAMAVSEQRFSHPQPNTPYEFLDYTYQVDGKRYLQLLRAYCEDHGVQRLAYSDGDELPQLTATEPGVINIQLHNDHTLNAHFIIDCTRNTHAFSALANRHWTDCRQQLPISWQRELNSNSEAGTPCVSSLMNQQKRVVKTRSLQHSLSSHHYAESEFDGARQHAVGYSAQSWSLNCLLLGAGAAELGGLLIDELGATHFALDKWLTLYPSCQAEEQSHLANEFNRSMSMYFQRVLDVHSLPFYSCGLTSNATESLLHRINLFRETGRVAFYEEDVLTKDQWVNWFISNGIWPERVDSLIQSIPNEQVESQLQQQAQAVREAVSRMPQHDQLLNAIRQSAPQHASH